MKVDPAAMKLPDPNALTWSNRETRIMVRWLFEMDQEYKDEAFRNLNEAIAEAVKEVPTDTPGAGELVPGRNDHVLDMMAVLGHYFAFWTFEIEDADKVPEGPGTDLLESALEVVNWQEIVDYMTGAKTCEQPAMEEDEFGPLFASPEQSSQFLANMLSTNSDGALALRDLEVMRESLELAITSKNWETATSRMQLAASIFERLCSANELASDRRGRIAARFARDQQEFGTVVYLNCAQGLLERASRLKTPKGRAKYISQARELLERGLKDPKAEAARLQVLLDKMGQGA